MNEPQNKTWLADFKTKVLAVGLAFILALGVGITTAAPAHAVYGAGVINRGNLSVTIKLDNGTLKTLPNWGSYQPNSVWGIYVPRGSCMEVGTKKYCVPSYLANPTWIILSPGQYSVRRTLI